MISRLFLPFLILVILIVIISKATYQSFNNYFLPSDTPSIDIFLNFIGVVYAIISAFVVFEAGSRFNGINEELSKEFIALRNVFSIIKSFNDPELIELCRVKIRNYSVTLKKKLYTNGPKAKKEVSSKFREIFTILDKIEPKNEKEKILLGRVVDSLSSYGNSRSRRLGLIESEISKLELFLVVFLSLSLIVGFFFVRLSNVYLFMSLMAIVSSAVGFILLIIFDMNSPFNGFWTISSEPISRTIEFLEED
ncbi:MAG: DUF4239 domain-containing protein [Candidatus Woykebacteria bacterium]